MVNAPGSAPTAAPDRNTAKEALVHFVTAFIFLLMGLSALVWNSGRLSQGAIADPRVLGGLHWITLGWLSLSIFGALRVFTGVALGGRTFGIGLVAWIRRFWVAGTVLFPGGLIVGWDGMDTGVPGFVLAGVLSLGVALILFTIHLVPALAGATRGELTRAYLAIALVSLWGAWLLGGAAAAARAGSPVFALPPGYFQAHLLFAVFGWVGATVVGVGSHLIPMFALSHEASSRPVRAALVFFAAIPILATIGAFVPDPFLKLGWISAGIGSALWIFQVFIYFRTRVRHERDPGLFLAGGATALLGFSWVLVWSLPGGAPVTFLGLALVGWLTLFTLGIYHRVLPFLIWFARFARHAGRGRVPTVKDLIDARVGYFTGVVALGGAALWGLGLYLQHPAIAFTGSAMILLGAVAALGQIRTLCGGPSA